MANQGGESDVPVIRDTNGSVVCTLPSPIEIGDCKMTGSDQSGGAQILLTPPNIDGAFTAVWTAEISSSHTEPIFGDTWHQSFAFKTRMNRTIVTVTYDSPTMHDDNKIERINSHKTLSVLVPELIDLIQKVDWAWEC